jgi:sugar transferase (PEP-CTERM/EpsH1 system associated)
MRILFLTSSLPYPPIGGERLRPFYFLKYLSRKHKIDLISFVENKEQAEAIEDYNFESIDTDVVLLPKMRSYFNCLKGMFSSRPLQIHYYYLKQMQDLINRRLNTYKYDLIFCHLIRMADYIKNIEIKKILDITDALSLRYSISNRLRDDLFRWVEFIEAMRLNSYEPEIIRKFDLGLVASGKDKKYLEENMHLKGLSVIPNGVELDEDHQQRLKTDPFKIVFFANMRAFPNIDALIYFYKEIFPLIKQRVKDIRLSIVGTAVPRFILSLSKTDRSVEICSDVPQIRNFVEDACVSVAPMRIAVGIQNKILQSMAFRIPVVATTLGLGGIEANPDEEILLADTPEEFSEKVIMLMHDEKIRQGIIDKAYRLVKDRYQWSDIVERLNTQCLSLIS